MKFQNPNLIFLWMHTEKPKAICSRFSFEFGGKGVIINKVILLTEQA